jgi:hypothetical protein
MVGEVSVFDSGEKVSNGISHRGRD